MFQTETLNKFVVALCYCFVLLLPFSAFSEEAASQLSCRVVLRVDAVGPYQTEPVQVIGWWKALFTWNWKTRSSQQEFNQKLNESRASFDRSHKEADSLISNIKGDLEKTVPNSHFRKLIADYLIEASQVHSEAKLEEELKALAEHVRKKFNDILAQAKVVSDEASGYAQKILEEFKKAPALFQTHFNLSQVKESQTLLNESRTSDEARSRFESSLADLQKQIAEFKEKEAIRVEKEKRFDAKIGGNSHEILDAYLSDLTRLELNDAKKVFVENGHAIIAAMEASPEFKKFIYKELQLTRRLFQSENKATLAVLKLRVLNNEKIAQKFIQEFKTSKEKGERFISLVVGTRAALRMISKGNVFAKTSMKGVMRKLPSFHREKLLAESLQNEELNFMIISSTVSLPAISKKPMVKPTKPVKPQKLTYTRYDSKYVKQSRRSTNLQNKQRYESQKRQFERDMTHYRKDMARYKETLGLARQADYRRRTARESLFAYLVDRYPELVLPNPAMNLNRQQVIGLIKQNRKQVIERRMSRMDARTRQQLENRISNLTRERDDLRNRRDDSADFFDWYMMMYTGNPMWIISPSFAKSMMFWDIITNPNNVLSHHALEAGLAFYTDSPIARAALMIEISQMQTLHPDYVEIMNSTQTANLADTDLNLANTSVKDAVENGQVDIDTLSKIEDEADRSMGISDRDHAIDNVDVDSLPNAENTDREWEEFKQGSDSDWVDDQVDSTVDVDDSEQSGS